MGKKRVGLSQRYGRTGIRTYGVVSSVSHFLATDLRNTHGPHLGYSDTSTDILKYDIEDANRAVPDTRNSGFGNVCMMVDAVHIDGSRSSRDSQLARRPVIT